MTLASKINLLGLRVLIVEDDADSSMLLSRMLAICGAASDTAANGTEALALFEEKRHPVIVTDICMPVMDGFELVERVRRIDKNTQIIATSANRETDRLISAIGLGFNDYFLKPFEAEKLLWAIKRCAETIGDRKRLEDEQQKFRTVVECLGEGIALKDLDYRVVYQNRALTEMFGDWVGSACYNIFGLDNICQECPTVLALNNGKTHHASRSCQINGETIDIESTASVIRDTRGTVTGTVEIIRDISERIQTEQTIRDLAFRDPLTGLANRRLFQDHLEQVIAKSRRYKMQFGLLTLDLDNFKKINDTLGHEAGDEVLLEAAERIKACCKRDLDTISRQGGDEFCIIFTDCGSREQLSSVAEKLLTMFARPFLLPDGPVEVTTSIGISIFPDNGSEMKELEIASDRAMYAAKKAGRNTYRFWEPYYVSRITVA